MSLSMGSYCQCVGVIGTGDYGRAFAARLVTAGYPVMIGSRNPMGRTAFLSKVNPILQGIPVSNIPECIEKVGLVILALAAQDQGAIATKFKEELAGKIVVDVSNPLTQSSEESNAERLQALLPDSHVVKAFNTISAYALGEEGISGESKMAYICSENYHARKEVCKLAASMALQVVDMGGLGSARALERSMQTLLPGWGSALVVAIAWFLFWATYSICYYYVMNDSYDWHRIPTNIMNKIFGCMAITLLALCYLPGCIVAVVQLVRGTKYKALPEWMCVWLKMRKQLGLYGLFFALLHCCLSLCTLDSAYQRGLFESSSVTIPANLTKDFTINISSRMNWIGETTILFASLSTALYCIVGITSLPSVGRTLNWREWNLVQSYFGLLCLLFACVHVTVKAASRWKSQNFIDILKGLSFLSQLIPYLVLFIRVILWIPCINDRLWNIRRGYIQGKTDGSEKSLHDIPGSKTCSLDYKVSSISAPQVGNERVNKAFVDMTSF